MYGNGCVNECLYDAIVCLFFWLFFEPQLHGGLDVCTYFSFLSFFFFFFASFFFFVSFHFLSFMSVFNCNASVLLFSLTEWFTVSLFMHYSMF